MHRRMSAPRSWRRAAEAITQAVVVGFLCSACGTSSTGGSGVGANGATRSAFHEVAVGGRRVTLPKAEWREMENKATFARNFEAMSNPPHRKYQIVTVFMIPMSEDRREGDRLSPNEYLEVFVVTAGEVVAQVRRDHGTYWVLSRETFAADAVPGGALDPHRALSPNEVRRIIDALRLQIDTTRHLLGERLRPS
jgi:hypothetical protein